MTKVLITGSSGRIGHATAIELKAHGYEVIGVDLTRRAGVHTYIADVEDMGQVVNIMAGCDAVIHLAAIPSPLSHSPEVVFRTNVNSTFNILQAAAVLGIKRVVMASSVSALGIAFRFRDFTPQYVPVDEDHPLLSQDAYGLSKSVGEHIAEGFVRRDPDLCAVSLRFTTVFTDDWPREPIRQRRDEPHRNNAFWTYIDVRDAARACRLGIEYGKPGHHPFNIVAPETFMTLPSRELMERFFPGSERYDDSFTGTMSPFDTRRAEQELGFRAQYDWEGHPIDGD